MICGRCGTEHDGSVGSGRFCSRSCANSRERSDDVKAKVRAQLSGRTTGKAYVGENTCQYCKTAFSVNSRTKPNKYCSSSCANAARAERGRVNALKSASVTHKRSKNEMLFAELCTDYFGDILTNEPMFNGWDADVILPQFKVAVLWNGPWHYKKLTEKHSLEQVQNRDRIKLEQIENMGYQSYVIRDNGSHNEKFVREQFEIFKTWIGETGIPRRS